jgi:hypothetical protein
VPRPLLDWATVQVPPEPELLPVTTVLLEPPELLVPAERLDVVCAAAIVAPSPKSATDAQMVFVIEPPVSSE